MAATQPFSPDQPRTENRNIMNVFSPDQAVVPVVMPVVLIRLPRSLRLSRVVTSSRGSLNRRRGCENGCSRFQIQTHKTFQMNLVAVVSTCPKKYSSSSSHRRG